MIVADMLFGGGRVKKGLNGLTSLILSMMLDVYLV